MIDLAEYLADHRKTVAFFREHEQVLPEEVAQIGEIIERCIKAEAEVADLREQLDHLRTLRDEERGPSK